MEMIMRQGRQTPWADSRCSLSACMLPYIYSCLPLRPLYPLYPVAWWHGQTGLPLHLRPFLPLSSSLSLLTIKRKKHNLIFPISTLSRFPARILYLAHTAHICPLASVSFFSLPCLFAAPLFSLFVACCLTQPCNTACAPCLSLSCPLTHASFLSFSCPLHTHTACICCSVASHALLSHTMKTRKEGRKGGGGGVGLGVL